MWEIFQSIGSFDRLKSKGSFKHYKKKLKEYQENEADVLIDMGVYRLEEERFEESIEYLNKALQIYHNLNEKDSEAFVLDLIGDVFISMRQMDKAIEKYRKAFKMYAELRSPLKEELFEKIKEAEDIKDAIDVSEKHDVDKEEVDKEGVKPTLSEKSLEKEIISENNLEEYLAEEETQKCILNYEKILPKLETILKIIKKRYKIDCNTKDYKTGYLRKAIVDAHKNGENEKEVAMLLIMGIFLLDEEKNYTAMNNFKDAFDLSYEIDDKQGESFSLLLLGTVYYILGKEDKIYTLFKKSIEIFKALKDKKGESIAMDLINTLYSEDVCYANDLIPPN